jgi:GWxTD domain-containing protein
MAGRVRAGRRRAAVPLLLTWLAWLAAFQSPGGPSSPASGADPLVDGPTRWLMLPDEQRDARRLRSTQDAILFLEAFWDRRDPDPKTPGNELARTFYERVDAADQLYSEGGLRGSLTDRGRALILLGPPSIQRYSQKRVPTWNPGQPGAKPAIESRNLAVETWVYQRDDLAPALLALLESEAPHGEPVLEVTLAFAVEPRRTSLVEGEKILELAVRAALRELPEP